MIKHADELRSSSRNKSVITSEIRDIIKAMEIQMTSANREGRTYIDFKVPKMFIAVGSDIDSMILIVSGTLRELIEAGYDVKIMDLGHLYIFTIRWESSLSKDDRKDIINFMKKHMVTVNKSCKNTD
jgi:hypothetical protein